MELFNIDPGLASRLEDSSEEELRVFAELDSNVDCDLQVELSIYASFLMYSKWARAGYLTTAANYAERWAADANLDGPERDRRTSISNVMSAWVRQYQNPHEGPQDDTAVDVNGLPIEETHDQVRILDEQAMRFYDDFQTSGSLQSLDEAIHIMSLLVQTRRHYVSEGMRNNYGVMLGSRFESTGSVEDLNQAIDIVRSVAETIQDDHSRRETLDNLANFLGERYEQTGSTSDLNEAIDHARNIVATTPHDHPRSITYTNNLTVWLVARYERLGSTEDLDSAVDIASELVSRASHDHPDRPACLTNLGNALSARFKKTDSVHDLDLAISMTTEAVEATPSGHPDRAIRLYNLGNELSWRFHRTGSMDDLHGAIGAASAAVDSVPSNHSYRVVFLNSLSGWIGYRYRRTGSMDDLNQAIDVAVNTVDATPRDHASRAGNIFSLGIWLRERFNRTGSMGDLNRAIDLASDAVDGVSPDHARHARYSADLGNMLSMRFTRSLAMSDINRAIGLLSMAVDSTAGNHHDRASHLQGLAYAFWRRFVMNESMEDLDRAVELEDMAVASIASNHPVQKGFLSMLGLFLGTRYEKTASKDDLNRAIDVTGEAIDATPVDDPRRAAYLRNHARWLDKRVERDGSWSDSDREVACLMECWKLEAASPSVRIQAASEAANILGLHGDWDAAVNLFEDALALVPALSPRSLDRADAESLVALLRGLSSTSAAAALNAGREPEHALRLLELGRGIIGGLAMDMRGDISNLKLEYPDLAASFSRLRDELGSIGPDPDPAPISESMTSWESQLKRRREADRELNELIDFIRTKPDYSNFLQPPSTQDLCGAAARGPIIVINTSGHRCDAFVIKCDGIQVVELPSLKVDDIRQRVDELKSSSRFPSLLKWLWEAVCRPCLDALGFTAPVLDGSWPHVWWIPTAMLSHLPIHAAGIYEEGSNETVLDRVVSSYAVSIKSLLYGRRNSTRAHSHPAQGDTAVIVSMSQTPGLPRDGSLPFAHDEVEMLKTVCPSLQLTPTQPAPRRHDLLKSLQGCRIFHFAGHGESDSTEPLKSRLLLEDWQTASLTVGDLMDSQLQEHPPFLAYLSACSTGAMKKVELSDEGIHLISAFQLAGFQHVVGTLWEVLDRQCVDVANCLYRTLQEHGINDEAVSLGIHLAVRGLRSRRLGLSQSTRDAKLVKAGAQKQVMGDYHWVPYVHFGV